MKTIQSLKIAGLSLALFCGGMTVMAQGNGNGKGNGHGTKIDIKTGGGGDKGKIQIKNANDGIKVDVKNHGNGNGDKVKIDIKGDNKGDHGKTDIKIGTNGNGKGEIGHNDFHDDKGKGPHGNGNGNAYGHNKGGMSGREFGQARAEEARNKHKDIIIVFEKTLSAEEIHIQTAKDRIKAAYVTINLMKADPKANKADIAVREATIKKAELKLSLLETQVVSGKATLQKSQSINVSVK